MDDPNALLSTDDEEDVEQSFTKKRAPIYDIPVYGAARSVAARPQVALSGGGVDTLQAGAGLQVQGDAGAHQPAGLPPSAAALPQNPPQQLHQHNLGHAVAAAALPTATAAAVTSSATAAGATATTIAPANITSAAGIPDAAAVTAAGAAGVQLQQPGAAALLGSTTSTTGVATGQAALTQQQLILQQLRLLQAQQAQVLALQQPGGAPGRHGGGLLGQILAHHQLSSSLAAPGAMLAANQLGGGGGLAAAAQQQAGVENVASAAVMGRRASDVTSTSMASAGGSVAQGSEGGGLTHNQAAVAVAPPSAVMGDDTERSSDVPDILLKYDGLAKPKRALSAYNLFFKDERIKLLREINEDHLPEAERYGSDYEEHDVILDTDIDQDTQGLEATSAETRRKRRRRPHGIIGFQEMAKIIGKRWKELEPEYLEEYKARAAEDKVRFSEQLAAYEERQRRGIESTREQLHATITESAMKQYLETEGKKKNGGGGTRKKKSKK